MRLDQAVREEGLKFGVRNLSPDDIEHIIWSYTGYPHFWPDRTKTPQENFLQQVRDFFASHRRTKKGRGQRRNRRNRR